MNEEPVTHPPLLAGGRRAVHPLTKRYGPIAREARLLAERFGEFRPIRASLEVRIHLREEERLNGAIALLQQKSFP